MESRPVSELDASPEVKEALERFIGEARREDGGKLGEVIVFGSVARGEAREGSDVDVLVMWEGPWREALDALVPITTRILLEMGVDVSVHPWSPEHRERLRRMRASFYQTVQREGVLVA